MQYLAYSSYLYFCIYKINAFTSQRSELLILYDTLSLFNDGF